MREPVSPRTGRHYPLTMICAGWRVARSSVYAARPPSPGAPANPPGKRGPTPAIGDAEVVAAIREVLTATPVHGEGYRKVRARLAHRGLAVGGKRVLRLRREHGLLAPRRLGPPNGNPAHAGTIGTDRPDEMWGPDATRLDPEENGWCWVFGAIDHHLGVQGTGCGTPGACLPGALKNEVQHRWSARNLSRAGNTTR